ncbi:MAG: hypothetical protein V3V10_10020 [Planctomycetota bacterium]
MKYLTIVVAITMFCGFAIAQDAPVAPTTEPVAPLELEDDKPAEPDTEDAEEVPADFSKYIHKLYPQLDLKKEHDLFNLKNYKDVDKRHNYTEQMTQVMQMYYSVLDMGSTFAKVFDQYRRGKHGNEPTFRCLYAATMLYYPPGRGNMEKAETMLRELAAEDKDYAFPWYFLAELYQAKMVKGKATIIEVQEFVDKALKIRPTFKNALLLSARLKLIGKPRRLKEAKELLSPLISDINADADILDETFTLYYVATNHNYDETLAKAKALLDNKDLPIANRTRLNLRMGMTLMREKRYYEAIDWLKKALKHSDINRSPEMPIRIHETIAAAWSEKAAHLKNSDPQLEGENSSIFEGYVIAAAKHHRICAEIEAKHFPVIMRGGRAIAYALFLSKALNEPEKAMNWLESYLAETDLTVRRRESLESFVRNLHLKLNPTELGFLDNIDDFIKAKDDEELSRTLGKAGGEVRDGMHFKTKRAYKTFTALLDHQNRTVVGQVSTLLEDTARTLGGDFIKTAGDALSKRLELETECVSDEQSRLQVQLHGSIRRLGHKPSWLRAMKHAKKMIDSIEGRSIGKPLQNVNLIWFSDEVLGAIKDAPEEPGRLDRRNKDAMKEFWDELITAIEAELAEEAKQPKEEPKKEPSE